MCKIHITQLKNIKKDKFINYSKYICYSKMSLHMTTLIKYFSTVKVMLPCFELLELGKLVFNLLP